MAFRRTRIRLHPKAHQRQEANRNKNEVRRARTTNIQTNNLDNDNEKIILATSCAYIALVAIFVVCKAIYAYQISSNQAALLIYKNIGG